MGLFETINNLHITLGPYWQGKWHSGFIEGNRYLYDYGVVFYEYGEARVITENEILYCKRNCVLILPPGVMHCTIVDKLVSRWCLHFDWHGDCPFHRTGLYPWKFVDSREKYIPEYASMPPPEDFNLKFPFFVHLNGKSSERLLEKFQNFFAVPAASFSGMLSRHGLMMEILGMIFDPENASENSTGKEKLANNVFIRAKSRFDSEFFNPDVNIKNTAAMLRVTPNHLSKLFRRNLGIPCSNYLQNLRLTHAEQLLSEGNLSIQELAFACGFSDANYFSRCFRKRRQMTPGAFRKSHLASRDDSENKKTSGG